jgi:hypothetical protein
MKSQKNPQPAESVGLAASRGVEGVEIQSMCDSRPPGRDWA